jgi:glycerol uptake facilitator-like aquaporin
VRHGVLDAGNKGVDLLGVTVAFGVAVLVMAYASARSPAGTSTRP